MKTLPYYRLWVKDFDTNENVRLLNLTEAGLYLFALNHAWVNDGLPPAPEDIARALKIPLITFKRHWVRVGLCFSLGPDGRLHNKRQEEERAEAISMSSRNTTNVRKRYDKPTTVGESYESGSTTRGRAIESESESVSDSSEDCNKETSLQPIREPVDAFRSFWGLFVLAGKALNDRDKERALKLWMNFEHMEQDRIVEWTAWQMRAMWTSEKYTPMPHSVLETRGWERTSQPRLIPEQIPLTKNERVLEIMKRNMAAAAKGSL